MEKRQWDIEEKPPLVAKVGSLEFKIKPYLSMEDKLSLIRGYLDALYPAENPDIVRDYITAEYSLILGIVDLMTDLQLPEVDPVGKIVESGIWEEIKSHVDLGDFYYGDLRKAVELYQKSQSLDQSIKGLLDKISQVDLSENGIKELAGQFNQLQAGVNELNKTLGNNPSPAPNKRGRPAQNAQP